MKPMIKKADKESPLKVKKYFRCKRCGYVTIIKNTYCPICAKEGVRIKIE